MLSECDHGALTWHAATSAVARPGVLDREGSLCDCGGRRAGLQAIVELSDGVMHVRAEKLKAIAGAAWSCLPDWDW